MDPIRPREGSTECWGRCHGAVSGHSSVTVFHMRSHLGNVMPQAAVFSVHNQAVVYHPYMVDTDISYTRWGLLLFPWLCCPLSRWFVSTNRRDGACSGHSGERLRGRTGTEHCTTRSAAWSQVRRTLPDKHEDRTYSVWTSDSDSGEQRIQNCRDLLDVILSAPLSKNTHAEVHGRARHGATLRGGGRFAVRSQRGSDPGGCGRGAEPRCENAVFPTVERLDSRRL